MVWPPDYNAILDRKFERLILLREHPDLLPDIEQAYKNNPVDFIEHWCVTYDPRNRPPMPKTMPFKLFPRQVDYVQYLYELFFDRESGLTEKCRDVGATWLCCAFSAWLWRFHDEVAIGWGSRKEEYVDKKDDPKAIFPKIRQIIANWPKQLQPAGYSESVHATYMKIINPQNGSTIIGEAGNNMGRGGRTTMYFKDESAHYEQPELIEAALGDNTDVQIDISSVNGTNNVFYQKRMAGEIWYPGHKIEKGIIRVFIFDWSEHPAKTKEWHERRRLNAIRQGMPHIFAQEVERNYTSAIDRIIIPPDWVNAAVDAHKVLKIPVQGEKHAGQDIADGGGDKNALVIRHGIVCRYAEACGGDPADAADAAIPACLEYGVSELYYDSIGVGAGFKVAINKMKEKTDHNDVKTFPRGLKVLPWNAAASVLDPEEPVIPDDEERTITNEEMYENLKAQSWFRLRTRFYKTYRAIHHGEVFDFNDLISLDSSMPRLQELKNELSQAQHKPAKSGKTMVDKKPAGAKSPNIADAFVICYSPTRQLSIFDVL